MGDDMEVEVFPTTWTPPEITNVALIHSNPKDTIIGWENVSCTVTDPDGIGEVKLVWTSDSTYNYTMYHAGGNHYYRNVTLSTGDEYTYHIWADDTIGAYNTSSPQPFDLPLNGDVNMDGKVHFLDLIAVSSKYNTVGPPGWCREDVDNNGKVHFMDLVQVSMAYNTVGPPGWCRQDVDNNGKVHFMDLVAVSLAYNQQWN